MVTSNKVVDTKIVKMAEQNNVVVVPQRTLLGEVNEHITCPLCHGYYIDATTIVECLHSFCRSCIIKHLQVKSYCPVCEMMINSAKPNIKLDKALQDIVYKLVPGLFQREMERRQLFYASRPGQAASATPEQRGEDTERIIFSPEDVISFSLEYADITDTDSVSSKSSDSNEAQTPTVSTRRYLQCPAVVNISHLKKFLCMKFDVDSTQFAIDILYKRVPLPDYYTLMDIAYIYNWKRNEPMRFFYQIIDYVAIRNRLFERKNSHFRERKSSPASTADTNMSSPAPQDHCSESSGTESPFPDDNTYRTLNDTSKRSMISGQEKSDASLSMEVSKSSDPTGIKKNDEEHEKSQFLNSFELTAKSSSSVISPVKQSGVQSETKNLSSAVSPKSESSTKRKNDSPISTEIKKMKVEIDHEKPTKTVTSHSIKSEPDNIKPIIKTDSKNTKNLSENLLSSKDSRIAVDNVKNDPVAMPTKNQDNVTLSNQSLPSTISIPHTTLSMSTEKTVQPLKFVSKMATPTTSTKSLSPKSTVTKQIPDLKPSGIASQNINQTKKPLKVRMDLLANNSDPTIDRSKILSQVKSSLSASSNTQSSGDPLKSLFDSCKINIPSSLSITLTDQKAEAKTPSEQQNTAEEKKNVNKNLSAALNASSSKAPNPPVHNYIEILKLADTESKKPKNKIEQNVDSKSSSSDNTPNVGKNVNKPSDNPITVTAKGPVPNLKPISDTKLVKSPNPNLTSPITFQQSFEQQIQSFQSDSKPKLPKNKMQVPKLVPATPKTINLANKLNNTLNKLANTSPLPGSEIKSSTALDLTTLHNVPSQLGPQHTKAFETMQSIANLAKKQNFPIKNQPITTQNSVVSHLQNKQSTSINTPLRIPLLNSGNQMKTDRNAANKPTDLNPRQDISNKVMSNNMASVSHNLSNFQAMSSSPQNNNLSRSQTRSPSTSPKLVIAEEKQTNIEQGGSNMHIVTSSNNPAQSSTSESSKAAAASSKIGVKPIKSLLPIIKGSNLRQPVAANLKPNSNAGDFQYQPPQLMSAHNALMHQQLNWAHNMNMLGRSYDLYKNLNIGQQQQSDFKKDNKQ